MTNKVNQPGSGQRKVTVRELVECELDLIIGSAAKQPQTGPGDQGKTPRGPSLPESAD